MIPANLLDQLREKDPGCYHVYGTMLAAYGIVEGSPMSEAWLQLCLQEAIRARGWLLEQSTFTASPTAKIWKKTDPAWRIYSGVGESEAEALCKAYLAALEAAE